MGASLSFSSTVVSEISVFINRVLKFHIATQYLLFCMKIFQEQTHDLHFNSLVFTTAALPQITYAILLFAAEITCKDRLWKGDLSDQADRPWA